MWTHLFKIDIPEKNVEGREIIDKENRNYTIYHESVFVNVAVLKKSFSSVNGRDCVSEIKHVWAAMMSLKMTI